MTGAKHTAAHYATEIKDATRNTAIMYAISSNCVDNQIHLTGDWVELAGPGAPTCGKLISLGMLDSGCKFVGVDKDKATLDGCIQAYGNHPDKADWQETALKDYLYSRRKARPFRPVSVIVWDGFDDANGRNSSNAIEDILDFTYEQFRYQREESKSSRTPLLVVTVFAVTHWRMGGRGGVFVIDENFKKWRDKAKEKSIIATPLSISPRITRRSREMLNAKCGYAWGDVSSNYVGNPREGVIEIDPEGRSAFIYKSQDTPMLWSATILSSET